MSKIKILLWSYIISLLLLGLVSSGIILILMQQMALSIPPSEMVAVADLGGVRGVQMHPPLAASNVFCVHNCTSPSNDYAAVACSNNNQAQLHTHVSVPY